MIGANIRAALAAFFLLLLSLERASVCSADLTQEEKEQKRLQFNAYVAEELAKARQHAPAVQEKKGPDWFFNVEPSISYDSNVNLNAEKQSSYYRELRADLGFKSPRPDLPLLGAGQWGMTASFDKVDYHDFNTLDTRDSLAKVFTTSRLWEGLAFKFQYEFEGLYYPRNDQLNFLSHKARPELFHEISKHFGHYTYGSVRSKNYTDRKALNDVNTAGEKYRNDLTYEIGYGWRVRAGSNTLLGLSSTWQKNDSNDTFDRFNDYSGWKAGGYVYRQLWNRASIVGVGGYDFKDYEARKFITNSDLVETDHFYYFGAYFYLDLSEKTQLILSYLYRQNNSSDPAQEYAGHLATLGVNVTL